MTEHDKALDPTGLILMGERYYDPKTGRFISPDPLGHPFCINLYAYTDGDPINYCDLDGRFASKVYQKTPAVMIANTFASLCANYGIGHSASYQVGSFDLQNGAIGFINGINNTRSESINYISRRDFVTRLDIIGRLRYGNELHILEPHPNAKFWDHEFASPTFTETIRRHIKEYIENYGGIE